MSLSPDWKYSDKVYHLISNTHWDREWRFPFQRNRQYLVDMIDQVLEILENDPDYRAFHLDSQTIVIEDYLQIKPHKRGLIEKFVQEKRLLIGPWYILPDEFLVSGECLVRNLLIGHRIAGEFGHVSKTGYSPFSWGQISQLPQIYGGFGIDVIMFYRGMNSLEAPQAEFVWEGADGRRILASRFSHWPRYNFYFYIYRPVMHNEKAADVEHPADNGEIWFHSSDPRSKDEDYHMIAPENGYYGENIRESVREIIDNQAADFSTSHVIWMEGHDSSGPNANTPRLLKDIRRLFPHLDVRHSTLEEYVEALKNEADFDKLPLVKGERRSAQFDHRSGNLFGYVTSARTYLKIAHFHSEKKLEYYAEPLNTIAGILSMDNEDRYIYEAWKLLVQNSAHDSIGGCSLDAIHEDMMNRYKQVNEISEGLIKRALMHVLKVNSDIRGGSAEYWLHVYNPLPYRRREVAEFSIDLPADLHSRSLKLLDHEGRECPVSILERVEAEPVLEQLSDRPMYFRMHRYHLLAHVQLNPLGFSFFQILPDKMHGKSTQLPNSDPAIMENEHLKIVINDNGSFDLIEKRSARKFEQCGIFVDEGEAGHAWVHEKAGDTINSSDLMAKIHIDQDDELRQKRRVQLHMPLPKDLQDRKNSLLNSSLRINMELTLLKDSPCLQIEAEVDNQAEDHRLRMHFPSGIGAEYHWAEGQYNVVKRRAALPDTSDWVEQPMVDFPLYHFADVSDGKQGLALFVDGLREYEFMDDEAGTLALTLIRAFTYTIQPASKQVYRDQKGSQMPGKYRFRMALMPHEGYWYDGDVMAQARVFNAPPAAAMVNAPPLNSPPMKHFIELYPRTLVLDAVKKPENGSGTVIRIHNPVDTEVEARITFNDAFKYAAELTLEELPLLAKMEISNGKLSCTMKAAEIKSYLITQE